MDALPDVNLEELGPQLLDIIVVYGSRVLGAIVLLGVMWVVSRVVASWVDAALKRTHIDSTVRVFAATSTRWTVRVLGAVFCLSIFGVETTSVAAVLGGAGIAIGVALKGNLSNLASGLLLLGLRPFKAGDWVEVDGRSGKVVGVGFLLTELDTFDNARHWVPNSKIVEQGLLNHEHHDIRRADVQVGVSYASDLERVVQVLREVGGELNDDELERDPLVLLLSFGSSSIDLKVGVWCRTPDLFQRKHDLILAIHQRFATEDIEIPFPQRDLHLRSSDIGEISQARAAK